MKINNHLNRYTVVCILFFMGCAKESETLKENLIVEIEQSKTTLSVDEVAKISITTNIPFSNIIWNDDIENEHSKSPDADGGHESTLSDLADSVLGSATGAFFGAAAGFR